MPQHYSRSRHFLAAALIIGACFVMLGVPAALAVPPEGDTTFAIRQQDSPRVLVLRVYFRDAAERDRLAAELDAAEGPLTGGYLTAFADEATYRQLLARGLRVEIDQVRTERMNTPHKWGDDFFGGYKTVEEMQTFLDEMAAAHPTLAQKVDIGDSWCKTHPGACVLPAPYNGYDLFVMHITNQAISGPKPVFWFDGGIHAREIVTPEVAMRFIAWLLGNYDSDADARWLVDWQDIWVMPMFNSDGHHIVEAGGGGNTPYYHRKTANNSNGCTTWPPTVGNQFGVDLNRNFPFLWNCCGGSAGDPCDQTYHGTGPASEPETQALTAAVRALIPDQRGPGENDPAPITTTGTFQSMHTYGEVNFLPWAHTSDPAPNNNDLLNIGAHMSAQDAGGNGYPYCHDCGGIIDGDSTDWTYGELGAPAFTTELRGSDFLPPFEEVDGVWQENRGMLLYLAKIARQPYLITRGPDAVNVAAVPMTTGLGSMVTLTGTIKYAWTENRYLQNVAAAEYYIDTPPWAGGTAAAAQAADGSFDSPVEGIEAAIDTTGLPVGRHVIFVRGRGVNSYEGFQSWGPVSGAFLDILTASPTPTATYIPTSTPTSTWTPTATLTPCAIPFTDVSPSEYFYEAVTYLYCRGIISGYADGTFRPYANTTRGQLSKIVVLAEGWAPATPPTPTFSDVPPSSPFYAYIEAAHEHGIISGYAGGTFRPGNDVTRGQLSKVVVLAEGWTLMTGEQHFSDVPPGSPFYAYVETAYSHNIVSGYAGGTFRPGNPATRGQIAKIVYLAITQP